MQADTGDIRTFIAVSLPGTVKRYLRDLQNRLRESGIHAAWPRPEALHLTLKFIGDISIQKTDAIKRCMEKAIPRQSSAPVLFASGIGVFPSVKNPRVIWSGIRGQTDILERLAADIEAALFDELGIKREKRRFSPHLTLARIKKPVIPKTMVHLIREFSETRSKEFIAEDVNCYRSELTSSGAIHHELFSVPVNRL